MNDGTPEDDPMPTQPIARAEAGEDHRSISLQPFALAYFIAMVLGVALIIAVVCTIATLAGKQEASFSFRLDPARPAQVADATIDDEPTDHPPASEAKA